ncbi:MAG TPA: lipopolysaccharide transport periplasmic protein LptA [Gammaproteobacteria bacterium]|nr:lipopolysaccharide transport periplasmic protein LptA [Gammaproteobacteria bacterium]
MSLKHLALIAALAAFPAAFRPALAAPAPATAPAAASSGKVLTVNADRSSAVSASGHKTDVVYSGHVVIQRGKLTLRGDRAVIHIKAQKFDSVTLTGKPATFTLRTPGKPEIKGNALSITYHAASSLLNLDGQVHFSRPGEHFSAEHIRYEVKTRRLEAHGKNHGRVHAVMSPASGSTQ